MLVWAVGAVLASLVLSVAFSWARAPWWDEGLYADVARQVAENGQLRSTLMGPTGTFGAEPLPHVDARTYWTMPLYPLVIGAVFKAVGVGVLQMRLLSVAWTLVLIAAWAYIAGKLTASRSVGLFALGLIALDSHVLFSASTGRVDPMCVALAALGIAGYLHWRETHLTRAVAAAAALFGAAVLTHQLAVVEGAGFALAVVVLDWRRLRPRHVLAGAAAAGAVLAPWLAYVLEDVATFRAQWGANAGPRTAGLHHPLTALATDLSERYLRYHFTGLQGISRARVLELVALVCCFAIVVAVPAVRRRRGVAVLAVLAVAGWATLAILDGMRWTQYFLHVYPAYLALASVALYTQFGRSRRAALGAAALTTALVMPGVAGVLHRVAQNRYRTDYNRMIAAVKRYNAPGGLVAGGSELAFGLGFDAPLVDDMELRVPARVYVQNEFYHTNDGNSPWQLRVRGELARHYTRVYASPHYQVFVRRGTNVAAGARGPNVTVR